MWWILVQDSVDYGCMCAHDHLPPYNYVCAITCRPTMTSQANWAPEQLSRAEEVEVDRGPAFGWPCRSQASSSSLAASGHSHRPSPTVAAARSSLQAGRPRTRAAAAAAAARACAEGSARPLLPALRQPAEVEAVAQAQIQSLGHHMLAAAAAAESPPADDPTAAASADASVAAVADCATHAGRGRACSCRRMGIECLP